eukprot:jgi/Mesvir1/22508/Mv25752-RA.1
MRMQQQECTCCNLAARTTEPLEPNGILLVPTGHGRHCHETTLETLLEGKQLLIGNRDASKGDAIRLVQYHK